MYVLNRIVFFALVSTVGWIDSLESTIVYPIQLVDQNELKGNTLKGNIPTLHYSILSKRFDLVKALLENISSDYKTTLVMNMNENGLTTLHCAAASGDLDVAKLLLESVPSQKISSFVTAIESLSGFTALHFAAINGHSDMINLLLGYVSKEQILSFVNIQDVYGCTALVIAIQFSSVNSVKELLRVVPKEQLHSMIMSNLVELTLTKNENGKKMVELKELINLIQFAVFQGDVEILSFLLNLLPKDLILPAIMTPSEHGITTLHLAVINGKMDALKFIVDKIPEDSREKFFTLKDHVFGGTVLYLAVIKGYVDPVNFLINSVSGEEQCRLVTSTDSDGVTTLDFAIVHGYTDIAKILLNVIPEKDRAPILMSNKFPLNLNLV